MVFILLAIAVVLFILAVFSLMIVAKTDDIELYFWANAEDAGLLPCPFCGDEHPKLEHYVTSDEALHCVRCSNPECNAMTTLARDSQAAIDCWNSPDDWGEKNAE